MKTADGQILQEYVIVAEIRINETNLDMDKWDLQSRANLEF